MRPSILMFVVLCFFTGGCWTLSPHHMTPAEEEKAFSDHHLKVTFNKTPTRYDLGEIEEMVGGVEGDSYACQGAYIVPVREEWTLEHAEYLLESDSRISTVEKVPADCCPHGTKGYVQ